MSEVLDAMFERNVEAGDYIIRQGDDGDNFYVVDRLENKTCLLSLFVSFFLSFFLSFSLFSFRFSSGENFYVVDRLETKTYFLSFFLFSFPFFLPVEHRS